MNLVNKHPSQIGLFIECQKHQDNYTVINEWDLHDRFDQIKQKLLARLPVQMIVEATDAVHPCVDQHLENLSVLKNIFQQSPDSQLIYYSVNYYTELDNVDNIFYRWIPEYHAYYYPIYQDVKVSDSEIEKKFLCLNKRVEVARWMLYKKFYTDDLLKDSVFSFLGENYLFGQINDINALAQIELDFQTAAKQHAGFSRLITPPEVFCQAGNDVNLAQYNKKLRSGIVDPTWLGNEQFYQSTFCSIVSETSPAASKPNFSEKIFRAICYGHPFILIGAQYSLDMLRKLGFDTYDDIFDNSYDSEPNRDLRILKIFDIIDNIASKNISELNEIKQQLLPRRLYNIKNYQEMYKKMLVKSDLLVQELNKLTR